MIELTARRREILRGVVRGWQSKEIAADLGITTGTVKNAIRETCAELGVDNRTMLAVMCVTDPELKRQLEEE